MNEPKKTTLAKTQLGWQVDKTEISQVPWGAEPYAHLLQQQPAARGSAPDQHQVHVQPDYVQQASAQQQQVQQYTEDPYVALAAQYGQQVPRTNANIAPRRAKGSTPPPATRNLKATHQPLFNDPTKPHSYNMASYVGEYESATGPQYHAQAYHAYNSAEPAVPPAPQAAVVPDYPLYAQHAQQADHASQYVQHAQQPDHATQYTQQQQQDYAAYAQQLQAYAAQQEAYAQQQAFAQQQQQTYAAQAQYTQQQQGYPIDPYAQTQYTQQPQGNDPYAQAHQPQYYDAASYQQAQYAAQYQQQVAAYEQQQRDAAKPSEGTSLGGIAAKLQKKAEKQKAKLQAALKKEGTSEDAREGKIAGAVATADGDARRDFVKKTYKTLFLAILAFAGLLWSFMNIAPLSALLEPFVSFARGGRWNWGVVLAAFVGASILAERFTHAKSRKAQYFGLGLYVLAESVIFVPLLAVVEWKTASIVANGGGEPNIIRDAAFMTLAVFGALTASVVFSKKDFSFLRSALFVASGAAMTLVVLSLVFGFNLGLVFSAAMVLLAGGYILYHTSQVLAHHHPEAHVAAALELFSSIALMFWYMIRIFMRARD